MIKYVFDAKGRKRVGMKEWQLLYQSNRPSDEVISNWLSLMNEKVISSMNEKLLRGFSKEEVEVAVFQIGPLKSHGPDDFGACFYQKFWSTVGDEVCNAILNFLNIGELNQSLNHIL